MLVTQERLREMLSYDPDSGAWIWRVAVGRGSSRRHPGDPAGCHRGDGYLVIGVDGRNYLAHQLAWFWMKGAWVPQIDHRDMNRSNNEWLNLREATKTTNNANRRATARNRIGVKGVFLRPSGRFCARIGMRGKVIHLGVRDTLKDAADLYAVAADMIFGEFARAV